MTYRNALQFLAALAVGLIFVHSSWFREAGALVTMALALGALALCLAGAPELLAALGELSIRGWFAFFLRSSAGVLAATLIVAAWAFLWHEHLSPEAKTHEIFEQVAVAVEARKKAGQRLDRKDLAGMLQIREEDPFGLKDRVPVDARGWPLDAWGRPFAYRSFMGVYALYSLGRNGADERSHGDDIGIDQGFFEALLRVLEVFVDRTRR